MPAVGILPFDTTKASAGKRRAEPRLRPFRRRLFTPSASAGRLQFVEATVNQSGTSGSVTGTVNNALPMPALRRAGPKP